MAMVKIAFTSDLHLPITNATVIADLAREMDSLAPDAVAILGDIGESLAAIEQCLATVKGLVDCPVLVVAGNHDLWLPERSPGRMDSAFRFREELPQLVESGGCIWLEGKSTIIDGVAVAGTIAWYDYSAVDPSIRETAEVFAQKKRYYNMDALRIDWPYTDPDFAALASGPFLATLDRLEADPAVRQTVVVTHVPLLDCQMCRKPNDREWGFSNAYFGNLTLGEQVIQRKKVTHIVSGHTHVGRHALVKLSDGRTVDARVLDSQYGRPAWYGLALEAPG
jgi:3',5'-cyclic AMP phosphodiesterase CpdA